MNPAHRSYEDRENQDAAAGERVCPFCGGQVIDIHGMAQCMHCHTLLDTCCEGASPNPHKAFPRPQSPGPQPNDSAYLVAPRETP